MTVTKLNQVLSIERATKATAETEVTKIYHDLMKPELLEGQTRTYQPADEAGEEYPAETKRVQTQAEAQLKKAQHALVKLFQVTAQKDATNCVAKADVVVDGKVLVKDAPATHLLFLDKKLGDLIQVAKKLPVLDPKESWSLHTDGSGMYVTEPVKTTKTKKMTEPLVMVQATKEHPAQVKEISKDIIAGHWTTIRVSGALPQNRIDQIMDRLETLQKAVRFAKQEANNAKVIDLDTKPVLDYIFS